MLLGPSQATARLLRSAQRGAIVRCLAVKRQPVEVFDRQLKQRQRGTMAGLDKAGEYDYVREEMAKQLVDRLEDITRSFPRALDLGAHSGHIYREICEQDNPCGIEELVQFDLSKQALDRCVPDARLKTTFVVGDEEQLPFEPASFDLVMSSLSLQWVNDIPATLQKIRNVLKPDGAFLGVILGGSTLHELRHCLYLAEIERQGGMTPHVSPLIQPSDCGSLLQASGFALPTVDVNTIKIGYADMFTLLEHIQHMGEAHAASRRHGRISRDTLMAAASIYQQMYGTVAEDGSIICSLQLIFLIGWSPAPSQPKPLKRGSATHSLKDTLGKNA